jgi:purine-binding chemotaxis protein CheW
MMVQLVRSWSIAAAHERAKLDEADNDCPGRHPLLFVATTFMTSVCNENATALRAKAGKYLTFALDRGCCAIPVLKVREIIRLVEITPVPQMPPFVRGVINLRGKIVPVMDLRVRFSLCSSAATERTCIIVVPVQSSAGVSIQIGLVVDAVEEVLSIEQEDMEETPDFGTRLAASYLLGMAKVKGKVVTLLDIDQVVGDAATEISQEAVAAAN